MLIINELGRCPTRSDKSILLTTDKHRLESLLLRFIFRIATIIQLNLNYIITDYRKLLRVFGCVLCEFQANQSNFLTFKN